jgi:cobalamin biosynthesis protein CobD/CbiB
MDKPIIGGGFDDARPAHIRQACRLMLATTLLFFMVAAITVMLLPMPL